MRRSPWPLRNVDVVSLGWSHKARSAGCYKGERNAWGSWSDNITKTHCVKSHRSLKITSAQMHKERLTLFSAPLRFLPQCYNHVFRKLTSFSTCSSRQWKWSSSGSNTCRVALPKAFTSHFGLGSQRQSLLTFIFERSCSCHAVRNTIVQNQDDPASWNGDQHEAGLHVIGLTVNKKELIFHDAIFNRRDVGKSVIKRLN